MMEAILGIMGSQSLLQLGALSVRFRKRSLVCITACPVSSNCLLYLVAVSIVLLSHYFLCPVVREWWAGADCMWEKSVGWSSL